MRIAEVIGTVTLSRTASIATTEPTGTGVAAGNGLPVAGATRVSMGSTLITATPDAGAAPCNDRAVRVLESIAFSFAAGNS